MNEQPQQTSYTVSDFVEWDFSGQLVLQAKFQRREVWETKAKSYLIDTIIRRMPIPPIYIRVRFDPEKKKQIREVVDGQQRLSTVLSYIKGDFPISRIHNQDFGGMRYGELDQDTQKLIHSYAFMVNVLRDLSDTEVLDIFARINTYTVKLNAQELRNAAFFGVFKQLAFKVGLDNHQFWSVNNIFDNRKIARMKEVDFVSELLVTMIDGIRATPQTVIDQFYKKYDDELPRAEQLRTRFMQVIDVIGNIFGPDLAKSQFRKEALFFSLFCVIYDSLFGLPNSEYEKTPIPATSYPKIKKNLTKLGNIIKNKNPSEDFVPFYDAATRGTTDTGRRKIRHDFIWKAIHSED